MSLLRGLAKGGLTVKALVVQPVADVKPGLIKDELDSAGWQLDIRQMEEPGSALPGDLSGFNALVIMGGPMNVYEEDAFPYLKQVDRLIKEAVRKGLPVLGACLGGQLIAKALGAPVTRSLVQEIGWYRMQLTAAGARSLFLEICQGISRFFSGTVTTSPCPAVLPIWLPPVIAPTRPFLLSLVFLPCSFTWKLPRQ